MSVLGGKEAAEGLPASPTRRANMQKLSHRRHDPRHAIELRLPADGRLTGGQGCQAHFRRNVIDRIPGKVRDRMHAVLDAILGAASQEKARQAFEEAARELDGTGADAALSVLEEGFEDATAVLALPGKYRRRLRTTNM